MYKFEIDGGVPLSGEVSLVGGKNSVIPVICATLLTNKKCVLTNVPKISDVRVLIRILKKLGSKVAYTGENELTIHNLNIRYDPSILSDFKHLRGSILFLCPLFVRLGKVRFGYPGGDRIGAREITAHLDGIRSLGGKVEFENSHFIVSGKRKGSNIFLYEPSVTATENLVMLAVLTQGTTVIENAACEPHVADLCRMLVDMGASISGIGTNYLKIKGIETLSGVEHNIPIDYIEVANYLVFALVTGGDITVLNIIPNELKSVLYVFEKFNVVYEISKVGETFNIRIPPEQNLYFRKDIGFNNLGIYTNPFPGFPTDLLSVVISLALHVKGKILFFEKMYEDRLKFALSFNKMGGKVKLLDSHRIMVLGPRNLVGRSLHPNDIRAATAYLSAALSARGKSQLYGVEHLDRAYPRIEKTLQKLGGKIKRIRL